MRSIENYITTMDSSAFPMILLGECGVFIHANPPFLNLLGYQLSELVGTSVFEVLPSEDQPKARRSYGAMVAGLPVDHYESRIVARDGRTLSFNWRPIHDQGTKVVLSLAEDLTDRRAKQRKVDELIRVVSCTPNGKLYEAACSELVTGFSLRCAGLCELLEGSRARTLAWVTTSGRAREETYELDGSACAFVLHYGELHISYAPRHDFPSDFRFTGAPGESYMGIPMTSLDRARLIGVLWVVADRPFDNEFELEWALRGLSTQVAAEMERRAYARELEKQLAYKRALLKTLPDKVIVFDENLVVIDSYSDDGRELTVRGEDCLGRSIDEVFSESSSRQARQAAQKAKATGEAVSVEYELRLANGEIEHYENCIVYAPEVGYVSHTRNVTERREYEKRIADQQLRLVNSAKMAAIGEMAAGIAHEINNPLCVITARAFQILKIVSERAQNPGSEVPAPKHPLAEAADHDQLLNYCASNIERMSNRIASIVRSMRTLARDGEKDPMMSCRLHDLLQDVLDICEARFRYAGVLLSGLPDGVDFRFECRPVQISQVIVNLLNNAYDAVQEAEEKWVRLEAQTLGDEFEFAVSDSGPGIQAEFADKVMMPFFTTKEVGRGTGLGLSISRAIVEDHGGRLELDTTSAYTRFVVRLPLVQNQRPPRRRMGQPEKHRPAPQP